MKAKYLLLSSIGVFVGLAISVFVFTDQTQGTDLEKTERTYQPRGEEHLPQPGFKGAAEHLNRIRNNPETGQLDIGQVRKADKEFFLFNKRKKNAAGLGLEWEFMGPDNVGGRTRALLIDQDDPKTMIACGVAGGVWRSENGGRSWENIEIELDSTVHLAISCIAQTTNGDIFIGTGESFGFANSGTNTISNGLIGHGIWKSTDKGLSWERLSSTADNSDFNYTYEVAADPNTGRLYAGCSAGLLYSDDAGSSWTDAAPDAPGACSDVTVGSDGTVIASVGNKAYVWDGSSTTAPSLVSGSINDGLIPENVGRLEFAFAPSDVNYVYCSAAKTNNKLEGIFQSKDKGQTWTLIAGGDDNELFQPYSGPGNAQGRYNNTIAVFPNDPQKVLVGGVDLYMWEDSSTFQQISFWTAPHPNAEAMVQPNGNDKYVHADIHALVFHPTDPDVFYIGSDGGVAKSSDGGKSFHNMNRGYGVTQFYGISCGPKGKIAGGTQDNGTQYINYELYSKKSAKFLNGGDGGHSAISQLNPDYIFSTYQYGIITKHEIDRQAYSVVTPSNILNAAFVTPITLWESFYEENPTDSVEYVVAFDLPLDSTIAVPSTNAGGRYVAYTSDRNYSEGDTLYAPDKYKSMLAIGSGSGQVFVSYKPTSSTTIDPVKDWYGLNATPTGAGTVYGLAFSKDGEYLYVHDNNMIWRVKGIKEKNIVSDSLISVDLQVIAQSDVDFNGLSITALIIDPQNPNNLLVTLGNYTSYNHVYYCTNAAITTSSTGNFANKQGDLPAFPVYSGVIMWNNSKKVAIGTEYGIYTTENILASNPSWVYENDGMPPTPVYHMVQQIHPNTYGTGVENHGVIYAGTHGRGVYKCETNLGPMLSAPQEEAPVAKASGLTIYPNPMSTEGHVEFKLDRTAKVSMQVYNMSGQLLIQNDPKALPAGENTIDLHVAGLNTGTYILVLKIGKQTETSKFIKY